MSAVVFLCLLALTLASLLTLANKLFPADNHPVADKIDALLPQTQCAQCGYPGCRPYAVAIAEHQADINLCPPGGEQTIKQLADLLGREAIALDQTRGKHKTNVVAFIEEDKCIGCKLCIQACPVDAILGAAKFMHTVIASECTGCELCIPPCPVDCILLRPGST